MSSAREWDGPDQRILRSDPPVPEASVLVMRPVQDEVEDLVEVYHRRPHELLIDVAAVAVLREVALGSIEPVQEKGLI